VTNIQLNVLRFVFASAVAVAILVCVRDAHATVLMDDAGAVVSAELQDAGSASAAAPVAAPALPDPAESPLESAGLTWRMYKAGHLVPAIVLALFFALTLAQRWIAWLRTGYRKLITASVLGGLVLLAERAANGETPSWPQIAGAIGVSLALYTKGGGE
jgi:hypothetical protein